MEYQCTIFSKVQFTYSRPHSVSNVGSKFKIFLSKKGRIILGSKSGSSLCINFENHSKHISRSVANAGFSAKQCHIELA